MDLLRCELVRRDRTCWLRPASHHCVLPDHADVDATRLAPRRSGDANRWRAFSSDQRHSHLNDCVRVRAGAHSPRDHRRVFPNCCRPLDPGPRPFAVRADMASGLHRVVDVALACASVDGPAAATDDPCSRSGHCRRCDPFSRYPNRDRVTAGAPRLAVSPTPTAKVGRDLGWRRGVAVIGCGSGVVRTRRGRSRGAGLLRARTFVPVGARVARFDRSWRLPTGGPSPVCSPLA